MISKYIKGLFLRDCNSSCALFCVVFKWTEKKKQPNFYFKYLVNCKFCPELL